MNWKIPFQTYAETFFETESIPGGAVTVVQGGEVVFAQGFGLRDIAAGEAATPDTIFGIASLTKSFTALALLILEAKGKFKLQAPLRTYLPAFVTPVSVMTTEPTLRSYTPRHTRVAYRPCQVSAMRYGPVS